jgi:N-acetylmuramoyl-L-alanine amidase
VLRIALLLSLVSFSVPPDLEDLARHWEFEWTLDAGTGRHTLRFPDRFTIAFVPGLEAALVNGAPQRLSTPFSVEGGRVRVPPEIVALIEVHGVAPLPKEPRRPAAEPLRPAAPAAPRLPCSIVIDAGHGGIHTGYKGRFLQEKDINLDVARELQRILEGWGARVVMTRTDDSHFSTDIDEDLQARVNVVNRHAPDLFVSIHANGADNAGARGFEVWVPVPRDARGLASRDLAKAILGELGTVWRSDDRGVKDEKNLRVLRGTKCPAVLVELEFVSNPQAERQLAQRETRLKLAAALADAVRRWVLRRK